MINTEPWFLPDAFRAFFSALDSIGYFLLDAVYDIFFTVASANIFQGVTINRFYSRVQLILGVFMVFKLSITLLQIIVNPDLVKDKQKGAGSIIMRIAVMLVLLTLIAPINIPLNNDNNTLNQQINNNGILFGFMYQFQNAIIEENILGKIVLGSSIDSTQGTSLGLNGMTDVGSQMAATVARSFIRPTLDSGVDEDTIITENDYKGNLACQNGEVDGYFANPKANTLINHLNDTCTNSNEDEVYSFDYSILGGFICSIIMIIIILGFTIDVAVRAVKLAILRLIAPIPIISYIQPGQEKNGAFGNWVKTLTSTYLSLFIRLIVIYFGIYLIVMLTDGTDNLQIWQNSTGYVTSFFATIFVIIGILMFMKEAPKFFQDMLGIKGDGKLFSGIGTMLGAAALTGGLVGSAISSAKTGYAEGKERGYSTGKSLMRGFGVGVGGFLGGAYAGGKALMTNDKKQASAVFAAMQRRNAVRAGGSTLFGRVSDSAHSMFLGGSPVDRLDAQAAAYKDVSSLIKNIYSQADADGDWIDPETGTSVKALKQAYENIQASGTATPERIALIRKNYEDARDRRVAEMMYKFNNNEKLDGNFAPQMAEDYNNILKLVDSRGLDLGNIKEVKGLKATQHIALHKARNLEHSSEYKARKASQKK